MSGKSIIPVSIVKDIVLFGATQVAFYLAFKAILPLISPSSSAPTTSKAKQKQISSKLGFNLKELDLTEHEEIILGQVVLVDDLSVEFKDIGGLEDVVGQLREAVIFPLCYPKLFESSAGLFAAPKGVLLYGPPGCGKTMLAKALAKESKATFINIPISILVSKWFGDSNKLISALFSLAKKLQPSIIFIDEIDSFLRERSSGDHEVTGMMKAEFMSMWDGLTTNDDARILVLGATNRPNDIDQAILRRMPKRFNIKLPNAAQRTTILTLMLKDISLSPTQFSLQTLVKKTDGLSGSDLKECCRNATMVPVREFMNSKKGADGEIDLERLGKEGADTEGFKIRPLRMTDFFAAEGVESELLD